MAMSMQPPGLPGMSCMPHPLVFRGGGMSPYGPPPSMSRLRWPYMLNPYGSLAQVWEDCGACEEDEDNGEGEEEDDESLLAAGRENRHRRQNAATRGPRPGVGCVCGMGF